MVTQQAQLKMTIPLELLDHLDSKARKFGITIASYAKHLFIKDMENLDYPEFVMSDRTQAKLKAALEDMKNGRLLEYDNVDDFFNSLR